MLTSTNETIKDESEVRVTPTNWNKCVLCQTTKARQSLRCPLDDKNPQADPGATYRSIIENIKKLEELEQLPFTIDLQRFDDGDGITETLIKHRAKWHNKCKLKFNGKEIERAENRTASKRKAEHSEDQPNAKYTRHSSVQYNTCGEETIVCFFCDDEINNGDEKREASTFKLDKNVRKCALDLQDSKLLAKLSAGDMVAIEAKYHLVCLADLYNRAIAFQKKGDEPSNEKVHEGIALAELLEYIEEVRQNSKEDEASAPVIFKLSELNELYERRLQQLGVNKTSHTTRLKNRILQHYPDMEEVRHGNYVLLSVKKDIGYAVKQLYDNHDDDAIILAKAAKIIRREMLEKKNEFSGTFGKDCQAKSVPFSLLAIVSMIQYGANIQHQEETKASQSTLSVAQLLLSNSYVRTRTASSSSRHTKSRETPLSIFLGLYVYIKTRKKVVIEKLHMLGLSISYDRVLQLTFTLANMVLKKYQERKVVHPMNLKRGIFTTGAVDNIDHNCSSTTATDSFHGTGISLFQHPSPEPEDAVASAEGGELTSGDDLDDRDDTEISGFENKSSKSTGQSYKTRNLLPLPQYYANVTPVIGKKKESPPPNHVELRTHSDDITVAVKEEHK